MRHPHGCASELAERVREVLRRHGYADQVWTETSAEHPAGALAGRIDEDDTALVVACGGDGTVRACADVLAHTGIPLAVVPCGTGNLLAHNLRLPADPCAALEAALSGETTRIDVGRVSGDGSPPVRFTVMAGARFDAAMVADASERAKRRLGWGAYALSAARHLGDPRMRLSIRLDLGPVQERRARMVVIGNVGMSVLAGLPLGLSFSVTVLGAHLSRAVVEVYHLEPSTARAWDLLRWPVGVVLALLATSAVFRLSPRRTQPGYTWLAFGATVYLALWLLATWGLSLYVGAGGSFTTVYGPLSAFVALLLWSYLTSTALFLGLAFAAQLEAVRAGVTEPATPDPGV
ncbi:YhjD/YihY/BrkB family envelope integrity protein [Streptomyces sp. NPDC001389]|uniref:YhjD/YihY/BrkB family envelope integrity protein n=1 Tax=Streptomyces sp. NPDC001389 TaxID=3364569 RepID=UPI0036C546B4